MYRLHYTMYLKENCEFEESGVYVCFFARVGRIGIYRYVVERPQA